MYGVLTKEEQNGLFVNFIIDEPLVTCLIEDVDGNHSRGNAKCDPTDEFSLDFGISLSASRAGYRYFKKQARRIVRDRYYRS